MVASRYINYSFIFFIIFVLFSFTTKTSVANDKKLILIVDKTVSILGRPIRAELYGVSLKRKITNINLTPLSKDFGVVTDYTIDDTADTRWPNENVQIVKFKLYPRNTGESIIPSITLGKVRTIKKKVNVVTKNTSVPNISFSSKHPYTREQFIINISIISNESTSRLAIKEKLKVKGFESTTLPFIRNKRKDGSYINTIGWAITPLKSGQLKLTLPPVEYSISGVSRKQFYFPHTTLNVKPLPSYLKPTITVGNVTLQSDTPTSLYLNAESISYWNININGNVNNSYRLPKILNQIKSNKKIKFLPAIIKRSSKFIDGELISTTNYSIPFKPLVSGYLELPKLNVQSFDSNTGKIETSTYHSKKILSLSTFWRSSIYIFILILAIYTFNIIYKKFILMVQSRKQRHKALFILENAENISDIKESIRFLTKAEYWKENITLHQWGMLWKAKYAVNNNFDVLIEKLSNLFYSSKPSNNLNELRLQLQEVIKYRK